jgi:DNA invertase Pin-like site-specific DNA recombinase
LRRKKWEEKMGSDPDIPLLKKLLGGKNGVRPRYSFIEKASGKDTARPQLEAMLNYARDGDVIIIHSMDRLARNLDDLRKLVKQLTSQKVKIRFSELLPLI